MFKKYSCLLVLPLVACFSLADAVEPLLLQPSQLKSLGIESLIVGEHAGTRNGTLPARVLVPNEQMRVVTAPVGGMVEMLAVAPGSTVKRGQLVARLASPQALELQRDALQSATQSALLQQSLKRDEQLFAEGLIAESRLQATRSAALQAGAQANERRQGLALAGLAPGKLGGPLSLVAPIDGVVLEQGVQLGQRIETSALIYRIAKLSPLWLEIQAPLDIASALREGMAVKLLDREVQGSLIAVGRSVDAASQTVLLRAVVGKGAEKLTPGQVIEVEIPNINSLYQRLPAAALVRHEGKVYAFVQLPGDEKSIRFEPRVVRVTGQGGDTVQVDNIKAGERVAVKGVSGLKALLISVGRE